MFYTGRGRLPPASQAISAWTAPSHLPGRASRAWVPPGADIAVPQAFALPQLPTVVTVLPGLPAGEDELLATQPQGFILQGLLARVFVGNMQGADVLEVDLMLHQ